MKFTDKAIASLKSKKRRYEVWEGKGFGCRVTPQGVKSWIWLYRYEGKARRMTLGRYPEMGLADANIKLAEARKALTEGKDPGTLLVAERQQERQAETVAELVEDYLEKWAKRRKRSWAEDERALNLDVIPLWRRRKANSIKRRDVRALLDRIVERGSPTQANRTLAITRKMFNWAISEDILESNPCHLVKAPSPEIRRHRVINSDEIKQLWHGLDGEDVAMSKGVRLALRLMLATAQRKGEVVNAEWSNFHDGVWTIPAEKSKNNLSHRVPLSPLAKSLLDEIKNTAKEALPKEAREAGEEPRWLFRSPRGDVPITGRAVSHALLNNLSEIGIEDTRPHDLRRTAASEMTSMGISRLVVSKILNHAEPGVTATYDRHSYDAEKRHALDSWSARLEEILSGENSRGNVVSLPQKT